MRITSITTMKDEAPFILEWVAYHRLIGVNDLIVFSNDCTDGTDMMLERLDDMGLVRHYTNPSVYTERTKHHLQVIRYVNTFSRLKKADWIVSLDVDEFICVNAGQGRLEDLFNAAPDTNVWSMSQLNFGHGGVWDYTDDLLGEQFNYCWHKTEPCHPNVNKRGTKTLTHRSSNPAEIHNHSPVFRKKDVGNVVMRGGSGQLVTDVDLTEDVKSLTAPRFGFDLVQLNHYALRSVESFLLKRVRGNANHDTAGYGMQYWRRYDQNDWFDDSIARWMPQVRDMRDELLQDPELNTLHTAAVTNAKARIAELKQMEGAQPLLNSIHRFNKRNPGIIPRYQAADAASTSANGGH